ncbi:hypothetical protein F5B22DRAFT_467497 [Xylaria bambusicola]|uniref:uncharacterized protein n=1 Tax=Xylaria bambusicola TaxID=326684 RepID=UPI0020083722|nr:uncharacterized protein F5B22DRAFT_467497 [Xylaria bambusicola]KAI0522256.1 hypothetical protein F5B22DRAFT_467497 [Xylaria bambusicola]
MMVQQKEINLPQQPINHGGNNVFCATEYCPSRRVTRTLEGRYTSLYLCGSLYLSMLWLSRQSAAMMPKLPKSRCRPSRRNIYLPATIYFYTPLNAVYMYHVFRGPPVAFRIVYIYLRNP